MSSKIKSGSTNDPERQFHHQAIAPLHLPAAPAILLYQSQQQLFRQVRRHQDISASQ